MSAKKVNRNKQVRLTDEMALRVEVASRRSGLSESGGWTVARRRRLGGGNATIYWNGHEIVVPKSDIREK